MNEDTKKKLKEKLGAVVSDEQLDNVAGGTTDQTVEILNALEDLDPNGVKEVWEKVGAFKDYPKMLNALGTYTSILLQKNLKEFGNVLEYPLGDQPNKYFVNGQGADHAQIMSLIKKKVNQDAF